MTLVLIMNDQCKNISDLYSHMILRAVLSLILIDQHSVTQMLYMSLSFISGETFIGWFFFFLSPLWQKAESLRNSNFLLVPGGRGQGSHKPSDRRDCHPAQEQKLCVPYLRAAFLSQLYRMISRFGDAWKINCVSLLCIVRTKVGVRFLFRVGEGIGMTNFSSGRFEPEQTWSFGG